MKDELSINSREPRCGTYFMPPIPSELQASWDELSAKDDYFAYALCRTRDGQAWEVDTKRGNFFSTLDGSYADPDKAMEAGAAWLLEQAQREPSANERADRVDWEERRKALRDRKLGAAKAASVKAVWCY